MHCFPPARAHIKARRLYPVAGSPISSGLSCSSYVQTFNILHLHYIAKKPFDLRPCQKVNVKILICLVIKVATAKIMKSSG